MATEMLVGLNVVNDEEYQAYRDEMTPILKRLMVGDLATISGLRRFSRLGQTHRSIEYLRFTFLTKTR